MGGTLSEIEEWYELPVPRHVRSECVRSVQDFSVLPPLELLSAEVLGTPSLAALLAQAKAQKELPPCCFTHPVVLSERSDPVVPSSCTLMDSNFLGTTQLLDSTSTIC